MFYLFNIYQYLFINIYLMEIYFIKKYNGIPVNSLNINLLAARCQPLTRPIGQNQSTRLLIMAFL